MLLSASPDAEALITGDLGKALSNQLDRAVLYGSGGVQPLGIAGHPDSHKITFDPTWWQNLTELEYQCATADVSELLFGYIVSPIVRRELRRTMVSNGGTDPIWGELPNPISSNVVTGNQAFGGCWDSCVNRFPGVWASKRFRFKRSSVLSGSREFENLFAILFFQFPGHL